MVYSILKQATQFPSSLMGEGTGGGESWKSPLTFLLSLKGRGGVFIIL